MDLWRWRPQEVERTSVRRQRRPFAKTVLRLPDLEVAKSAVLNSLSCPDAQRGYRHAIDEFVDWYCLGATIVVQQDRSRPLQDAPGNSPSRARHNQSPARGCPPAGIRGL